MDRASDYESAGRVFESPWARQLNQSVIKKFQINCGSRKVKEWSPLLLDYDSQRNIFFYRNARQEWYQYPSNSLIGEASKIVCK